MAITNIEGNGEKSVELTDADYDLLRELNGQELTDDQVVAVEAVLSKDPRAWTMLGDLCAQVRYAATDSLRGNSAAYESVQEGIRQMRKDLRAEGMSEVERLIIEQILTCWVQCAMVGRRLEWATAGQHHADRGVYWDRRYNAAHARFLRSVEALARIRKLKIPNLQLNIAEKQINVSGG